MGTSYEEIESMAMTTIKNDPELDFCLAGRRAVFFNTMAAFMKRAIPLVNRPPELVLKLREHTVPEFADAEIETENPIASEAVISTGLTGYDICSVGVIAENKFGQMEYTPAELVNYNKETGEVKINGDYEAGTVFTVECYRGAAFEADLNDTEKEIIAAAINVVYEYRFDNDSLERTLKISDRGFETKSEASHMTANTARRKLVEQELYGKLRAYQDNLEYINVVMNAKY